MKKEDVKKERERLDAIKVKVTCRRTTCKPHLVEIKSEAARGSIIICPECGSMEGSLVELVNE